MSESFKNATGTVRYRKSTGDGSDSGSGAVLHQIIDSGTVTTVSTVTSLSQFAGSAITLGAGAVGAGTLRTTLASDDPAVASLSVLDDWDDGSDHCRIVGAVAHDAAASGNPVLIGAYASTTAPTDVSAAGDAVRAWALLNGTLCVNLRDSSGNEVSVGGGTQYTEDAAAAANPVGTVPMLVRKDTPASEVTTDGDNIAARGTAYGAMYVTLLDTGGSAVSVGGGTQYTEDAAAAANPIGNALNLIRADTLAGLTTADGDNVAARGTDKGELYVKHVDAIPVTDNGGSLTIDGSLTTVTTVTTVSTVTTCSTVTTLTTLTGGGVSHDGAAGSVKPHLIGAFASAAAPTDVSADGDATQLWCLRNGALATQPTYGGVLAVAGNGASGTGVQRVTIANDSTGVLATVSTVTTVATLTGGGVAHDGADSGNPIKVGAKATAALSGATMVADGDRTNLTSDLDGAIYARSVPLGDILNNSSQSVTDTTSTAVTNFGATASAKNHITQITVFNSSATAVYVKMQDGNGGTTFYVVPAPAGGGAVLHFNPPLRQPTANTALYFAASASASTVYVSINGFKSKV